jgi:hypothetical protein
MKVVTAGRRGWTDDQLAAAVRTQTSWRAVARSLGLKGTSAAVIRTLRRHALRLSLDTSHFTGQRTWTDDQLRTAIAGAATWSDVLCEIGVVDNSESRARVKSRGMRLGLEVSHLATRRANPASEVGSSRPISASLDHLRRAAPAIAMAWYQLRGCAMALPIEPQPYDLLATTPEGIQRVQIKSATNRDADGRWQVSVGRRPYVLDKCTGRAPYDPEDLDTFFIVNGAGGIYLVPIERIAGQVVIVLDAHREFRVGDASSLLR